MGIISKKGALMDKTGMVGSEQCKNVELRSLIWSKACETGNASAFGKKGNCV